VAARVGKSLHRNFPPEAESLWPEERGVKGGEGLDRGGGRG
jgi:hypothetical protein